jgi:hypothetical protein
MILHCLQFRKYAAKLVIYHEKQAQAKREKAILKNRMNKKDLSRTTFDKKRLSLQCKYNHQ